MVTGSSVEYAQSIDHTPAEPMHDARRSSATMYNYGAPMDDHYRQYDEPPMPASAIDEYHEQQQQQYHEQITTAQLPHTHVAHSDYYAPQPVVEQCTPTHARSAERRRSSVTRQENVPAEDGDYAEVPMAPMQTEESAADAFGFAMTKPKKKRESIPATEEQVVPPRPDLALEPTVTVQQEQQPDATQLAKQQANEQQLAGQGAPVAESPVPTENKVRWHRAYEHVCLKHLGRKVGLGNMIMIVTVMVISSSQTTTAGVDLISPRSASCIAIHRDIHAVFQGRALSTRVVIVAVITAAHSFVTRPSR